VLVCGRIGGHVRSGGFQDGHYCRNAAKEVVPAVVSGNMLMRAGAGTEEVTQFIESSTEPVSRSWAFESTHGLVATFDAAVILLQSIIEIAVGAVLHASTQRRPDGTGVAVMAIRGHPGFCSLGAAQTH
jgi:hypothetical protein